ncbi:MAG: PH domain-containing protein [Candidatus Woesearchaeota archaeon]
MIKPFKDSFVYFSLVKITLFFCGLFLALSVFGFYSDFGLSYFFIFLAVLYFFVVLSLFVRYRKERYELGKEVFKVFSGSFFSDFESELVVKNIVQVSLRLPFLEYKFFGTGTISVKAAGSSGVEIKLSNIKNPKRVYEDILDIMKSQGFTLSKKNLLQREVPNSVAVFLDVFKEFVLGVVIFFLFYFSFIVDVLADVNTSLIPLILLVFVLGVYYITRSILRFLDLKRKVYYLYEDTIYYEDGFLTENYSFIPIENLSDTDLTQTFIDRLLDLYDLKISSKGQSNEIHFSNIVNGKLFEKNLKGLIKSSKQVSVKKTASKKIDKSNISSFKMNFKRMISANVLLLVFGLFVFFVIGVILLSLNQLVLSFMSIGVVFLFVVAVGFGVLGSFVKYYFTKYFISKNSFESHFDFLTSRHREFSVDKVTFVEVLRNPIDRFFKTVSVNIMSIGSNEILSFEYVDEGVVKKVFSNLGYDYKGFKNHGFNYGFVNFVKGFLPLTALFFVVFFVGVVINVYLGFLVLALFLGIHLYLNEFYNRAVFGFKKDILYYKRGLIFVKESFALFDNVKSVSSLRYPKTNVGSLSFDVTGEVFVDNNQNSYKSNGFSVGFLSDVLELHDFFDEVLGAKSFEVSVSKKPSFANALTVASFPLITVVYIPFYFVLAPVIVIKQRRKDFVLEKYRVVKYRGVFYRKKKSVLYERIDHISKSEGLLNKVYSNGNIFVFTVGSSRPDLVFRSLPDYNSFYEKLEKNYK